jgi:DNA methylase
MASPGKRTGRAATHSGLANGTYRRERTLDWSPSCRCDAGEPVPQTVLDPFLGSGTTALVADRLERNAIGIELSSEYAEMSKRRLTNDAPMFANVDVALARAHEPRQARLLGEAV